MTEEYYNMTAHGTGFEGFLNYANTLVDGWMVIFFLIAIYSISMYVLSKSEWKLSSCSMFSFFICMVSVFIFRMFTIVNEIVIFICIIGLVGSIIWARLDR